MLVYLVRFQEWRLRGNLMPQKILHCFLSLCPNPWSLQWIQAWVVAPCVVEV